MNGLQLRNLYCCLLTGLFFKPFLVIYSEGVILVNCNVCNDDTFMSNTCLIHWLKVMWVLAETRVVSWCVDQMHNVNGYVRDFYFFRRNFYPQLSLVHMNPTDAALALHSQVSFKFIVVWCRTRTLLTSHKTERMLKVAYSVMHIQL